MDIQQGGVRNDYLDGLEAAIGGISGSSVYKLSDWDDSSNPEYWGYVDANGNWLIKQTNNTNRTNRFAAGTSNYPTNWTGRTGLTYDYYYNVA